MNTIYTIGFAGKNAKTFFELLRNNKIQLLIDVRLNNVSQLAGYTKKNDLEFFLKEICDIKYCHLPILAPTKEILDGYKKGEIDWSSYEQEYMVLIDKRKIGPTIQNINFNMACLLCSEKTADMCHRRLAAEILKKDGYVDKIIHF